MPSIALFIKQLLSEDKYSSDFSDKISERIKELNAAQLQGIYNHLVITAKNAKSQTWAAANQELINKIEGVLKERVAEAAKVDKILEEEHLRQAQKKRRMKEAKIEQVRVMKMIAETARKTAEDAVRAEEQKRVADEKIEIMAKVFQGEEKRNEMLKKIAVGFVIGIVVVSAASPNIIVLIPCLFFVFLVTGIFCYKAQMLTVVVPTVVDESELELEIERRGDVLKKKAISSLQEKERKFQEQQARDEEERKMRKAQKKAQLRFEAQLMATRRQQQLAMANEVITRRNSVAGSTIGGSTIGGSMNNLSGRSTPMSERSEGSSYHEASTDYGSSNPNTARTAPERQLSMLPTIPDSERLSDDEEGEGRHYGEQNGERREEEEKEAEDWESARPFGSGRSKQQRSAKAGKNGHFSPKRVNRKDEEDVQLWGETVAVKAESLYGDFENQMLAGNTLGESSDDYITDREQEHLQEAGENEDVLVDIESQQKQYTKQRKQGNQVERNLPRSPDTKYRTPGPSTPQIATAAVVVDPPNIVSAATGSSASAGAELSRSKSLFLRSPRGSGLILGSTKANSFSAVTPPPLISENFRLSHRPHSCDTKAQIIIANEVNNRSQDGVNQGEAGGGRERKKSARPSGQLPKKGSKGASARMETGPAAAPTVLPSRHNTGKGELDSSCAEPKESPEFDIETGLVNIEDL